MNLLMTDRESDLMSAVIILNYPQSVIRTSNRRFLYDSLMTAIRKPSL